jgi:hypothetical protein
MARNPTAITDDIELAGRFVVDQIEVMRRRGWLPLLVLAGAVGVGLVLSGRPARHVARDGARLVDRSLKVAAALAAIERFRARSHARAA